MSHIDVIENTNKTIDLPETLLERYDVMCDKIRQAEVLAKFMHCSDVFAEVDEDMLDYFAALSDILNSVRTLNDNLNAELQARLAPKYVLKREE